MWTARAGQGQSVQRHSLGTRALGAEPAHPAGVLRATHCRHCRLQLAASSSQSAADSQQLAASMMGCGESTWRQPRLLAMWQSRPDWTTHRGVVSLRLLLLRLGRVHGQVAASGLARLLSAVEVVHSCQELEGGAQRGGEAGRHHSTGGCSRRGPAARLDQQLRPSISPRSRCGARHSLVGPTPQHKHTSKAATHA